MRFTSSYMRSRSASMFVRLAAEMKIGENDNFAIHEFWSISRVQLRRVMGVRSSSSFFSKV